MSGKGGADQERIIKQAGEIGWHNVFDCGYGLQPTARYYGDGLGPLPRARPRPTPQPERNALR
jgi:hypothetical protein